MLWVLASQTRTIPSSDPESKRFPRAQYAKQVTALLEEKKKKEREWIMNSEILEANTTRMQSLLTQLNEGSQSYLKQSTISQWYSLR